MRMHNAVIALCISAAALSSAVKQRIAVMPFGFSGTNDTGLVQYAQKVFEREIDRTDAVNLIRSHLWKRYVAGALPTPRETTALAAFGFDAKVEGVICGSITLGSNIIVTYIVHDVLSGTNMEERTIRSAQNEEFYLSLEKAARESAQKISRHFTPKEPEVIVRERTERRIRSREGAIRDHSLQLSLGGGLPDHAFRTPFMTTVGGAVTNAPNRYIDAPTMIAAGICYRFRQFGIDIRGQAGIFQDAFILESHADIHWWLIPDTVAVGLMPLLMSVNAQFDAPLAAGGSFRAPYDFKALRLFLSLRCKPNDFVNFGIAWMIPYVEWGRLVFADRTVPAGVPVPSMSLISMITFFDFHIGGGFGIRADITILSMVAWDAALGHADATDGGVTISSLSLCATYRFGWN
ncbi:MAG: hypothetical protein AABZ39_21140 [Spirochaetota bacterium]